MVEPLDSPESFILFFNIYIYNILYQNFQFSFFFFFNFQFSCYYVSFFNFLSIKLVPFKLSSIKSTCVASVAMPSRFFGSLYCARQEGLTCGVIQSFNLICFAFSEDLKGSVHTLYAFLPPIQHVVPRIFSYYIWFSGRLRIFQLIHVLWGIHIYIYINKCNVNANYSNL